MIERSDVPPEDACSLKVSCCRLHEPAAQWRLLACHPGIILIVVVEGAVTETPYVSVFERYQSVYATKHRIKGKTTNQLQEK